MRIESTNKTAERDRELLNQLSHIIRGYRVPNLIRARLPRRVTDDCSRWLSEFIARGKGESRREKESTNGRGNGNLRNSCKERFNEGAERRQRRVRHVPAADCAGILTTPSDRRRRRRRDYACACMLHVGILAATRLPVISDYGNRCT